jgi:predicted heme/steroid binding protein
VRAVRQGSATAFYGPRPLKTDSYVVVDGAFYDVFQSGSYTVELPALETSVEWESGRRAPESASHRSFADLPRVDRRALRSVVYGGIYRTHVHPETRLVHSESPVPYPDGVADSELPTDDPLWVRWDDRDYRVTVHRVTTVRRCVYEYAASKVAPNAEAFRRRIADRYLVRLDDLTPEQRTILDEAIGEGYHRETRSCFSTFHRLEDRLPERTLPESDTPYYVEYEGTRYGLSVSWVCQGTWSCGR